VSRTLRFPLNSGFLRDVLIHGYFGVDLEIVWSVVDKRLPELAEVVDRLLAT
jgi:uncharacterized protein with HEPN domain